MSMTETTPEQNIPTERARWFSEEMHPHDAALKNYLRRSFPAIRDVEDIAQESYIRVWKQQAGSPIRSAKAFLFAIARHLALNALRHERRSPVELMGNLQVLAGIDQMTVAHEAPCQEEKVKLMIEAIDALPARCHQVVVLRKLRLVSQRETAALLGITEKGVENQLARGLERCRKFLRRHGVTKLSDHGI